MGEAWVGLDEAIEGLRQGLTRAIDRGAAQGMHFRVAAPVEVTLQAVLTWDADAKVAAWKVLEVGASRESSTTQTVKLSLTPVWRKNDGTLIEDPLIAATLDPHPTAGASAAGAGRGPGAGAGDAADGVRPDAEDDA